MCLFYRTVTNQTEIYKVLVSPVLCANRTQLFILGAEVWRTVQVDQFVVSHWPDVNVFGDELLGYAHGSVNHLGGREVSGLKVHGNLFEVLEGLPAGSYGAGSRNSMALTF